MTMLGDALALARTIPGYYDLDELTHLFMQAAVAAQDAEDAGIQPHFVELGAQYGRSTSALLTLARAVLGRVTVIDNWCVDGKDAHATDHLPRP